MKISIWDQFLGVIFLHSRYLQGDGSTFLYLNCIDYDI